MYIFLFLWVATVTCWPSTSALPVQEQRERRGIPPVIPKPLRDPIENTGVKRVLQEGDIYVDRRRNAVRVFEQTWFTRIIPFDIHPSFDSHDVTEIQLAMQEIMSGSNLCVKFTPRTTEEDFLYLTKLDGCWSAVGRRGGNQTVSVGDGCNKKGIIMHELMHALGFWHEHNRPDRDNYINILWNNIIPEHTQDFDLTNKSQTLDSPYDYLSIMHYKANTFSKDPATLDTITPKNILVDKQSLGQREYLSDNDKVRIRRLYQCNDTMCPYPNIPNGLADGTNLSVGSSIKFSCKSGYMLIGNPDRSCMKNGAWSGAEPKCLYRPVVLHYCNFDNMDLCSWTQQILDKNQIQWTWWSKETPTDDTGPYVDHTRQGAPGYYLYMESSDPARTGNYALLTSPAFPVSSGLCMSFYYFMYGRKVGSLEVFMRQGLYPDTLIWSISGNQSAEWNIAFITLKIPYITNFQILIKATRADSPYGDIAIDDVLIGRCQDLMDIYSPQGSLQTILTKPADGTINYKFVNVSCSFDDGLCGWTQDQMDDFDWTENKGPTPSLYTGPECDRINCSYGGYVYTEASGVKLTGDTARLISPIIKGLGTMCLSFYYHMYGEDIGAFAVFFVDNNEISRQLWNISGNQGQGWQFRQLEIDILETFQIVFQATRGPGFRSDAAIDDVNLISGPCAPVLECDFEIDFCSFMNPNNTDDFDWSRNKGATLTHITGPSRDHTSGDGFYAYIETSIPRHRGDSADLVTPVMNGGTSGYCIAFWYHMFGPNVDTLSVKLRDETGNDTVVWSAHGEQGSEWIFQELMILGKVGLTQIVFEAMVGASYGGDIALDDIRIVLGQC